jgi:hypothetical protein
VHAVGFDVIDPDINFSDHLPIMGSFQLLLCATESSGLNATMAPSQLRWDRADLQSFHNCTCYHLEPILARLDCVLMCFDSNDYIDYKLCTGELYDNIAALLNPSMVRVFLHLNIVKGAKISPQGHLPISPSSLGRF